MAENTNNNSINRTGAGLNTDLSPEFQAEGTQRFVLNGVNESEEGNILTISNELGNIAVTQLPEGYKVLSKLYIEKKEVLLFLVNQSGNSEIGIFNGETNKYTTYVNDTTSVDKLNFSTQFPIDSTYRLRRGCERNIYFTDYNNPPRVINLDSLEDYQENNLFSASKTNLFRSTNQIPYFKDIEVLDSGGQLLPGSYNIAIQYVDESLNPTEWFNVSDTVVIYHDSLTKEYKKIEGSINSTDEGLDFGPTNKSIRVKVDNLDENFVYYRLALISATSGNGQITNVQLTNIVPIQKDTFIFTGNNTISTTTEAEIIAEKLIINKARHILQVDNTLILGDTIGSEVPFCELQQYASRINSDVVIKKITIDDINDPQSGKNPELHLLGQGYTPGEIYSFGIQYIFEDGEFSPVYHIPGKRFEDANTVFSPGANTRPMSPNNISLNTKYIENDNCDGFDYWGKDYRGKNLKNTFVRHHRFPLRSELNLPLVTLEDTEVIEENSVTLRINFTGTTKVYNKCEVVDCTESYVPNTLLNIVYSVDGILQSTTLEIDYTKLYDGTIDTPTIQSYLDISTPLNTTNVSVVSITETSFITGDPVFFESSGDFISPNTNLSYTIEEFDNVTTKTTKKYSAQILGIKFSNINLPSETITGKKVVGYQIVRNERTDSEKTILDSAVLTSCLQNDKYISHGLLFPDISRGLGNPIAKYNQTVFGLIHPEHKFFNKRIQGYDTIIQEGVYYRYKSIFSTIRFEDVADGTSYNAENHKENEKDDDGLDLKVIVRDSEVDLSPSNAFTIPKDQIEDIFYLDALESRDINKSANTVYNIAGDNKVGILQLKAPVPNLLAVDNRAYHVVFKRSNLDSYSNFRNLEYYKEHENYSTSNTIELYHGDSYISPMKYANTVFWDIQLTKRAGKSSFWKKLVGIIAIVGGVLLSIFTGGTSAALVGIGAGLLVAGTGAMMLASGVKRDAWNKAYGEEYDKGLRETALDQWVYENYRRRNGVELIPPDDEIQWIGDAVSNFWFESQVNISLRNGFVGDLPAFLEAPGILQTGNITPEGFFTLNGNRKLNSGERFPVSDLEFHFAAKLLYFDPDRKSGRAYYGHPLGEYYSINPDYLRRGKQKIYYHLPLEYDCCSDCNEEFPHRWFWSQQSFQEELIDNFRVFLPNNYKDLDGETGRITNMFKINNDLFVHSEGALYLVPRNYQERITDQIVSFIGTGELFSIPPQKISDSNTYVGGTNLKWANVKTIYGYFFVSDVDKAIYLFNGQNLKKISDENIRKELSDLLELKGNTRYNSLHDTDHINLDKLATDEPIGFTLVYDEEYKRVIITKLDSVQDMNTGFTLSYDLKTNNWVSYHSYIPYAYIQTPNSFYSVKGSTIYKHNERGLHNTFYGETKPFIIEFVGTSNPLLNVTTESLAVHSRVLQYDKENKEYYEITNRFFNKLIAYNSKQCTGELNIEVKKDEEEDFFASAFQNSILNNIVVSCKENVWRLNNFRDSRVVYNKPIFTRDYLERQSNYFIDKKLIENTIDINKDWTEKELMRDKYLVIRLIFDNFVDTKIITNLSVKNDNISSR